MSKFAHQSPTHEQLIGQFMQEIGRMSTGNVDEMAELIGATTGAVTGIIDRLEKHGKRWRAESGR